MMKPNTNNLWLFLEDEHTDFLWLHAKWYTDDKGHYQDDNQIPADRIGTMTKSLFGT